MEKILEVRNLQKKFRHTTAVQDLSFSIEKGAVYGLLGPNGSGKSTTFGMLLSTINPTAGEWYWFGEKGTSTETLKRIGAIIEQPNFYPYLSAEKNLEIVAKIKGTPKSRIPVVLQTVGLLERKNDPFRSYSLGMKQRLSIASALLNAPEVLILDEPTNGLDPEGIIQIREIISSIAKDGITILIASHLLDEVEKICSHVVVLKKGHSIYSGRVDEITANQGFFQLKADDMGALQNKLTESMLFSKIIFENDMVIAHAERNISPAQLNKLLAESGIYLSELSFKKQSLETQFLELVKTQA